ncbi:MAG: transcription termination/antitermination protein NusG [Deltaproteobacteria bacterium]|nr:transcription termination/antitermination protein NusG [Candidatus Anaeroferrophillus wilburensis]MBN2888419.1 transcription termination/antitermination protein NusG [Deltaproteobacteria bacterium]
MTKKWYVIHAYSGYENKVKQSLEERIKLYHMESCFDEVVVPTEQVIEMVKGKKRTSHRKFFPGYVLVKMELNDETWHVVKDTPKVTGFVGGGRAPRSISEEEAQTLLNRIAEGEMKPKPKIDFEVGENVRVTEGPFANFTGSVDDILLDKGKVRVLVSIFGRPTPIEIEFGQIEKI